MIKALLILLFPLMTFGQDVILSGQIVDGKTKEPIPDVLIRLYVGPPMGEYRTTTDSEGNYSISTDYNVEDKDYPIIIEKSKFQVVRGVIKLNFGEEPQRDYRLYPMAIPVVKVKPVVEEKQDGPSLLGAPTNSLTFLIDVSGSMEKENRLDNLKASLLYLAQHFRSEDKISIITYSSYPKVLLNDGNADDVEKIIKNLSAGGKSEGYSGLQKAYDLALTNFKVRGNNKIILATDGIFGEDKKSQKEIEQLIENGSKQNVVLSVFAFDDDNEIVSKLQKWTTIGEGNFTSVLSLETAKAQIIKEAKGK